jgi:hypothetical protein
MSHSRKRLASRKQRTNDLERLQCIARSDSPHDDFDNQMATFPFFVVNLDLNMDRPKAESEWKRDPTATAKKR